MAKKINQESGNNFKIQKGDVKYPSSHPKRNTKLKGKTFDFTISKADAAKRYLHIKRLKNADPPSGCLLAVAFIIIEWLLFTIMATKVITNI